MAKKQKNFKVIIEINEDATIFDSTNSKKEVKEWIKAATESNKARSIKVYRLADNGGYTLDKEIVRRDEPAVERAIGFGRW